MSRKAPRMVNTIPVLIPLLALGCGPQDTRDVRLAEATRHSLEQQAKQNEHLARQSERVAAQSEKVAETAKHLVESDAAARREIIDMSHTVQRDLSAERRSLDRQHEALEAERQRIAASRHRDPIVAAAINSFALMLVCVLPLLVCLYILRHMARTPDDTSALTDVLLLELMSNEPRGLLACSDSSANRDAALLSSPPDEDCS